MKFERFLPCDPLKPFVDYLAVHEGIDETPYKVLPGTGLVIGFQFKGRLFLVQNGNETALAVSGVTGLMDAFKTFRSSPDIGSVLVYFKEQGASQFFKEPLHELFGQSVSLENFLLRSELLVVEEQLCEAKTDLDRVGVVERFLVSQFRSSKPDPLVAAAVAMIYKHKGNVRIATLAQDLFTSQSPLEKRFRQQVGTSAKKFASIVRMKHVLTQLRSGGSHAEVRYEAGFYDQAHFIKEFKTFTGDTPSSFKE